MPDDRHIEIYPERNPAYPLAVYHELMDHYGIDTVLIEMTPKGQFRIAQIRAINKAVAEAFNGAVRKRLGDDFALHGVEEK